jgi:hypothetical protein
MLLLTALVAAAAVPERRFAWWYHAAVPNPNVTAALNLLRASGGAQVASSWLVYCNDTIDPQTGRFTFGSAPACALSPPTPNTTLLAPALRAMGVQMERCLGHVDDALTLRRFLLRGDENLAELAALVHEHRLAGFSFDIEARGTTANDTVAYARWLGRARDALHPLGARLTAYAYSSHHSETSSDFGSLSSSLDRLLDGDTYNYRGRAQTNFSGWLSEYTKLVGPASNVSLPKAAPAMMVSTERGAWNCDAEGIEQRMARVTADGVREVAGFAWEPSERCSWSPHWNISVCHCTRAWLGAARAFLAPGGAGLRPGHGTPQ